LIKAKLVQRSLFDERNLAEITSDDFPGERLVVCRNPQLAEERARKREDLLRATEKLLEAIHQATCRRTRPLRGEQAISLKVGKAINKHKMEKHFEWTITSTSFTFKRNEKKIREEALLDGLYVVRTSVSKKTMTSERVVETYKSLSYVERAFRCLKTADLQLRPIYHHKDERIRAHVFLCMLSYYIEWHMRQRLREVLFEDCDRESARASRSSPVAPAVRSEAAKRKDATRFTAQGHPVQGFRDLLRDLATLARNRIRITEVDAEYDKLTAPTEYQRHVFNLLNVTI
jgi:hypothetical protein